ncbi:MAG: DUF1015 family protein [Saprospiraceae bacterium]
MEIKPFPAIFPNLSKIAHPDSFFQTVKEQYTVQVKQHSFLAPRPPSIYIHQIRTPRGSHTGLIASVPIEAYLNGEIKGHEETIESKSKIQLDLFLQRQAIVKPVLLTYPNISAIDQLILAESGKHAPFLELFFEEENLWHVLWEIKEDAILQQFQALFREKIPTAYIADGHHRISAAVALSPSIDSVMCAFFPSSEVRIRDFNRLISAPLLQTDHILKQIAKLGEFQQLAAPQKPQQKHELTLLFREQWYRLKWKADLLQPSSSGLPPLDTQLLNEHIFRSIFHIKDLRTTTHIKYIEGQEPLELVHRTTTDLFDSMAFFLYPIQLAEMMAWADHGHYLPPKSTWFEPRMKNGVVVQGL